MTAPYEKSLRKDLAARFGWDDTLYTHFSVRLPSVGGEERCLHNPFGLMFDEVCASDLIVVDAQGQLGNRYLLHDARPEPCL